MTLEGKITRKEELETRSIQTVLNAFTGAAHMYGYEFGPRVSLYSTGAVMEQVNYREEVTPGVYENVVYETFIQVSVTRKVIT